METVIEFKKFNPCSMKDIEDLLKSEKSSNPSTIPYYFGCFADYP